MRKTKKEKLISKPLPPDVSIFDSNSTVEGNITSENNLEVNCEVNGDCFTTGKLIVTANAIIKGNVKCRYIIIYGKVIGDIEAQEDIVLSSTAIVLGDCICRSIIVKIGAFLSGSVKRKSKDEIQHIAKSPAIALSKSVVTETNDVRFTNESKKTSNDSISERLW